MTDTTVNRRWLIRRLLDIEAMGSHTGYALRELIEELGDDEAIEPQTVELSTGPCWKRVLDWQFRRTP